VAAHWAIWHDPTEGPQDVPFDRIRQTRVRLPLNFCKKPAAITPSYSGGELAFAHMTVAAVDSTLSSNTTAPRCAVMFSHWMSAQSRTIARLHLVSAGASIEFCKRSAAKAQLDGAHACKRRTWNSDHTVEESPPEQSSQVNHVTRTRFPPAASAMHFPATNPAQKRDVS
jgi:hypothetical protein